MSALHRKCETHGVSSSFDSLRTVSIICTTSAGGSRWWILEIKWDICISNLNSVSSEKILGEVLRTFTRTQPIKWCGILVKTFKFKKSAHYSAKRRKSDDWINILHGCCDTLFRHNSLNITSYDYWICLRFLSIDDKIYIRVSSKHLSPASFYSILKIAQTIRMCHPSFTW